MNKKEKKIRQAVKRGVKEYHETFRLLAEDKSPKPEKKVRIVNWYDEFTKKELAQLVRIISAELLKIREYLDKVNSQ